MWGKGSIIRLHLPSFLPKALSMRNWHKDGPFGKTRYKLIMTERNGEQTFEISSPILINGLNWFNSASNDVTKLCLFNTASDTSEMRGRESFIADIWAWSTALPATADIESCATRTYSWAELGLPSLSTKDRPTSNCRTISLGVANHDPGVTCLHSVASVEVQVNAPARCQFSQGTCPWVYHRAIWWWWFLMSYRRRAYRVLWVRHKPG